MQIAHFLWLRTRIPSGLTLRARENLGGGHDTEVVGMWWLMKHDSSTGNLFSGSRQYPEQYALSLISSF
jgi:hypothetical protein